MQADAESAVTAVASWSTADAEPVVPVTAARQLAVLVPATTTVDLET